MSVPPGPDGDEPEPERDSPEASFPPGALSPADVPAILLGAHGELEVEIGMGNGHFLAAYAAANPHRFFIGIERKRHRVLRALKKVEVARLSNVRVVLGRAEAVLDVLPRSSVSAFHIYFLDPWPKSKHRKRRFLRRESAAMLFDRLRSGGRILFATDMLDYYLQAKILFVLCGALSAQTEPPEETHRSVYSARFRETGTKTFLVVARKPTERESG